MRLWLKISLLTLTGLLPVLAGDKRNKPPQHFDPVVPIGHPVKGMHLPYYNTDNTLRMQFDAEVATRIDQDNIQLDKLRIESFDEDGKSDMVVTFPAAVFNLTTNIISSKDEVLVKRADFEITGKGMEFDTTAKNGRLYSNIRMVIYNKDAATKPKPANTPATNGQ